MDKKKERVNVSPQEQRKATIIEKYGGFHAIGKKAAETNKERHGEGFFARIGAIGGAKSTTGGFGSDVIGSDGLTGKERASIAGKKGGTVSRRTKLVKGFNDVMESGIVGWPF